MQKAFDLIVERLGEKLRNLTHNHKLFEENHDLQMMKVCESEIVAYVDAIEIVNQVAEEYKTECNSIRLNDEVCEWKYDEFEEKWQTDCDVLFKLHDSDTEITKYCPYCGKKIKVVE